MKEIARGAEAVIYEDKDKIIKERIKKNYRIPEIDIVKRKYPTRREFSLLEKANSLKLNVPKVYKVDDKNMIVEMEKINGEKLRDVFEKIDWKKICKEIGEQIAVMHDNNIIHGDLTTSNILIKNKKAYFIDFGLGFISDKIEDKAVDLHLMKQALESRHYEFFDEAFKKVLEGYKKSKNFKEILSRLEKVEKRGRYKKK